MVINGLQESHSYILKCHFWDFWLTAFNIARNCNQAEHLQFQWSYDTDEHNPFL